MKSFLIIVFVTILCCSNSAFSQEITEPKLVATYSYSGGGDYLEFIEMV